MKLRYIIGRIIKYKFHWKCHHFYPYFSQFCTKCFEYIDYFKDLQREGLKYYDFKNCPYISKCIMCVNGQCQYCRGSRKWVREKTKEIFSIIDSFNKFGLVTEIGGGVE